MQSAVVVVAAAVAAELVALSGVGLHQYFQFHFQLDQYFLCLWLDQG